MKYRGVIFDFNGVLLWDAHLQEQSWRAMALSLRGKPLDTEECAIHMHGRPNAYVLNFLAGRAVTGKELENLIQQKESYYRELCLEHSGDFVLSPGAAELLDDLAIHDIPRTIATSSEKTNLDFFIEHLELGRWFDTAKIVYDDGRRPGKPAPDIYLQAAANIAHPSSDCIVVEDAVSGIQSAHAAGIGYIVALNSGHPPIDAMNRVSATIQSLAQFPRELLCISHPAFANCGGK